MRKTNVQTAEVFFPWSKKTYFTIAERPVRPKLIWRWQESIGAKTGEKITIWWWNGPTCVYHKDGTVYRFWPKPTMADAVRASVEPGCEGCSFRFHPSGVVEEVYQGNNYYWSADKEVAEPPVYDDEVVWPGGYCDTAWFDIFDRRVFFEPENDGALQHLCTCYDCLESAGVFDSDR